MPVTRRKGEDLQGQTHLVGRIAADLDGNLFRVFHDFASELSDRGGRVDDAEKREAARAKA